MGVVADLDSFSNQHCLMLFLNISVYPVVLFGLSSVLIVLWVCDLAICRRELLASWVPRAVAWVLLQVWTHSANSLI